VNVTANEKSSKLASKPDSTGVPPFYYFLKKKMWHLSKRVATRGKIC
jgi:hypothetical protein